MQVATYERKLESPGNFNPLIWTTTDGVSHPGFLVRGYCFPFKGIRLPHCKYYR